MKRFLKLLAKPQPPYRTIRLEPIHIGNLRRFRVYAVTTTKDRNELLACVHDIVEITRGKSTAIVFVFLYHDEEEVGKGMPVVRALFERSGIPNSLKPMGLPGERVEVEDGTITIDMQAAT